MKLGNATLRTLARNAGWLGAGEGFVKAAIFIAAALVARATGAEGLGTFSIAYAAAVIVVIVLASGQQEVLIREVAGHPQAARSLLIRARRIQNRMGLFLIPAALVLSLLLTSGDLRSCLIAFLPYSVLRSILVLYGATFKGLDRMDVEVRARAVEMILVLTMLGLVILLHGPIWSTGLIFSAGAGVGLLWIRHLSRELHSATDEAAPLEITELSAEGRPFLAMSILSQLLMRADTFILAALAVSRKEIGYYAAAGAPVWGALALPHLLAMATYPTLSRDASEGERPRSTALFSLAFALSLGFALALTLFFLRSPLIRLAFGPGFESSVLLMSRLVWVLPPAVGMVFLGTVLASWRRQQLALGALSTVFLLFLILNLLLIPDYGTMGAAFSALISQYSGFILISTAVLIISRSGKQGR